MNSPYMPWIDHLPEVGEPITKDRDRLAERLAEARRLELQAEALRAEVIRESTTLFDRVAGQWSGQDIAKAHTKAEAAESALTPWFVADPALREQLRWPRLPLGDSARVQGAGLPSAQPVIDRHRRGAARHTGAGFGLVELWRAVGAES